MMGKAGLRKRMMDCGDKIGQLHVSPDLLRELLSKDNPK